MKRIFLNINSKVLKGISQSAITWYQWVCLCWHHTCAHIHFPQGSVRVSALSSPPCSPSSPVSASQSPGPSPRHPATPPPSRRAASLLTMHPSPHLSSPHSPSPGYHGPTTRPAQPHIPSHTVPISPPKSPKSPIIRQG